MTCYAPTVLWQAAAWFLEALFETWYAFGAAISARYWNKNPLGEILRNIGVGEGQLSFGLGISNFLFTEF